MDVTIDLKTLLVVLVLIALVVLIIFGILLVRKLMVTLEHANKILTDVETISELAASRSQDLDGIVENVSVVAEEISGAMAGNTGVVSAVSSVAKSAASLRGLFAEDEESRSAKRTERKKKERKRNK